MRETFATGRMQNFLSFICWHAEAHRAGSLLIWPQQLRLAIGPVSVTNCRKGSNTAMGRMSLSKPSQSPTRTSCPWHLTKVCRPAGTFGSPISFRALNVTSAVRPGTTCPGPCCCVRETSRPWGPYTAVHRPCSQAEGLKGAWVPGSGSPVVIGRQCKSCCNVALPAQHKKAQCCYGEAIVKVPGMITADWMSAGAQHWCQPGQSATSQRPLWLGSLPDAAA